MASDRDHTHTCMNKANTWKQKATAQSCCCIKWKSVCHKMGSMGWKRMRERGRERGEMYCRGLDRSVYLSFVIPHDFCPEAARRTNTLAHTPAVDKDVQWQNNWSGPLVSQITSENNAWPCSLCWIYIALSICCNHSTKHGRSFCIWPAFNLHSLYGQQGATSMVATAISCIESYEKKDSGCLCFDLSKYSLWSLIMLRTE